MRVVQRHLSTSPANRIALACYDLRATPPASAAALHAAAQVVLPQKWQPQLRSKSCLQTFKRLQSPIPVLK